MSEYEELVKSLRQCAEGTCNGCKYELTQVGCKEQLQKEAADAIEKSEKTIDKICKTNESLRRKIQRMKSGASWDEDIRRGQVQGMW